MPVKILTSKETIRYYYTHTRARVLAHDIYIYIYTCYRYTYAHNNSYTNMLMDYRRNGRYITLEKVREYSTITCIYIHVYIYIHAYKIIWIAEAF